MTNEELKTRSKHFAHRCVKLCLSLPNSILGRHIQGQLIRCSTSVAANYRAACLAQSKAAFIAKMSITVEETDESLFWLEFIMDEKLLDESRIKPLYNEGLELAKIFISSRMTASGKTKVK